jgi:hypothetical protein
MGTINRPSTERRDTKLETSDAEKRWHVSEDQTPNQPEQQEPIKERPTKRVKAAPMPPERAFRSYWPLALAVALMVMLVGLLVNLVVLGIGVVLAAVAIIGWGLERR